MENIDANIVNCGPITGNFGDSLIVPLKMQVETGQSPFSIHSGFMEISHYTPQTGSEVYLISPLMDKASRQSYGESGTNMAEFIQDQSRRDQFIQGTDVSPRHHPYGASKASAKTTRHTRRQRRMTRRNANSQGTISDLEAMIKQIRKETDQKRHRDVYTVVPRSTGFSAVIDVEQCMRLLGQIALDDRNECLLIKNVRDGWL
ncbi:uncharacterized protein LOC134097280 [Sardina pilchardus]|uniref:uncharacterized protein LOC134097280 n=1 Tax=Sardina pilchardus TaxID=27697 RepID=UPI002E128153